MPYRPGTQIRFRISGTLTAAALSKDSDVDTGRNWPAADRMVDIVGGATVADYQANTVSHPTILAVKSATAPASGGALAVQIGSVTNMGIYFGTGAPSVAAATGSFYMNQNGTTTNNRGYLNTGGGTYWTAITTAA